MIMNQFEKILMNERVRLGIVTGNHHQRLQAIREALKGVLSDDDWASESVTSVELDKSRLVDMLAQMSELENDMDRIVRSIYAHMAEVTNVMQPPEPEGEPVVEGSKGGQPASSAKGKAKPK